MRLSAVSLCALALSLLPARLVAQGGGGTLRGVVRDSADRPLVNVEVVATPGPHRARTDSLGRFTMAGIGGGKYILHARKLGYSAGESTADIHGDGFADVKITLDHRMADLDTVVVREDGSCPERSLDGFMCRRKRGDKGVFMDYLDIDDKDPLTTADLFRDIPGFRDRRAADAHREPQDSRRERPSLHGVARQRATGDGGQLRPGSSVGPDGARGLPGAGRRAQGVSAVHVGLGSWSAMRCGGVLGHVRELVEQVTR